jgi:hypothetical protein
MNVAEWDREDAVHHGVSIACGRPRAFETTSKGYQPLAMPGIRHSGLWSFIMTISMEEKAAIALRVGPQLKSSSDPDTWRMVFLAAIDTGVTFDEAVSVAEDWEANKTAEYKAMN